MTIEEKQNLCLIELGKILNSSNCSLKDIPTLPFPDFSRISGNVNRLLQEELNYDYNALHVESEELIKNINTEQTFTT